MFQEVEEADETGEQLEAGETERAAEQAKMIGKLSNFWSLVAPECPRVCSKRNASRKIL